MDLDDHDFSSYTGMSAKEIHERLKNLGQNRAIFISNVLKELEILPSDYDYTQVIMGEFISKVYKIQWED